jgi:glucokinase
MRFAGIDLADDRITAVIVDESGTIVSRATPASRSSDAEAVSNALRDAAAGTTVDAVGVTIPYGALALPAAMPPAIAQSAEVQPIAVHAGNAVALAEAWCGAARGSANVISFCISEHVTAGILIGGEVLHGANGHAGSVAWLALNPVEREDYRRHGGLEAEVASAGIVRRLVWRIKSGDRSRAADLVQGDLSRLSADDVFAAARDGDGVCVSVIRDTAKYVGMAIANLITVLDPEFVVLGGTLASSGDLMLEPIRTECSRRMRPAQVDAVRIVLSSLGTEAAAVGAARAAMLQKR